MASSFSERLRDLDRTRVVLIAAAVLIAAQALFRGWAIYGGWFYGDDYKFLAEGHAERAMTLEYLLRPHNAYFMPGGRAMSWMVAHSGPFNWTLAASFLLALQVLASCACWFMLHVLFGPRPWCLALLAWYLFSPITLTAFMWWAAAINQLPFQAMFFVAIATHVLYLRTRSWRWAVLTILAILVGLFFYMKALLIVIPLGTITLLFGTDRTATWLARLRESLWDHWRVWVMYAVPLAAYVIFYRAYVPSPFRSGEIAYADIADVMFRVSLGSSFVGGPWEWADFNPPLAVVAPPEWAVTVAWMVIAAWVALMINRRRAPIRAFLVPASYLLVTYLLLAGGRGADLGGFAALELRYLADSTPVLLAGLGLFSLPFTAGPVDGRPDPSPTEPGPTDEPLVSQRATRVLVPITVAVVMIGAVWSSVDYARFWTGIFPAKTYIQGATNATEKQPLLLVEEAVPNFVVGPFEHPFEMPEEVFATLGDRVTTADRGNDLDMLANSGKPYPAYVEGERESVTGPAENCGYVVKQKLVEIPMEGDLLNYFWWMQISYLAGDDGTVEINYGDQSETLPVERGTHSLYLKGEGPVDPITITATTPGLRLCVDRVAVGRVQALEPLS